MADMIIIDKSKPELVEVEIPSYEGSRITMLRRLPIQYSRELQKKYRNAQTDIDQGYDSSLESLTHAIQSWNLGEEVNGEQKVFDINVQNVESLFSSEDITLLGAILRGRAKFEGDAKWSVMTEEEKKRT